MASSWLAVSLLACAAVVAGWPAYRGPARRRLIMGGAPRSASSSPVSAASAATGRTARGPGRLRVAALRPRVTAPPRLATLMTAGLAAFLGAATGGPVAAVVAGAYGGLAMRTVLRRQLARKARGERVRQLDGLCALAADLRAGLPVPTAASAVGGIGPAAGASAAPPDAPP
jgi:tight adherence protein B